MTSFNIYQNANSQPNPASFILFHEMSTIAMTGPWIRIFKDGPCWSTRYFSKVIIYLLSNCDVTSKILLIASHLPPLS